VQKLRFKLQFSRVSAAASRELSAALVEEARLSSSFVALTLASSAIATFGLLENSAAVIIGAMIIAPLLAPIQALAYGVLDGSVRDIRASCISLCTGSVLAVGVSGLLARAIGLTILGSEVMSRTKPNVLDLGIALAAGLIGGFARTRPGISNTIAGTAIAVALMPPLCVLGIGLATGDSRIAGGALLLFITNLFGITLASTVVFFFGRIRDAACRVRALLDDRPHGRARYPVDAKFRDTRASRPSRIGAAACPDQAYRDVS
jgi:uncharacterized hydrophobic protein (TIGR00271 family)